MADPAPSVPFDTAAARADGVSDADIAAFLAPRLGFDLGAARKDGVSDSAIVDFLAPPASVKAVAAPEPESGTLKGMGKAAAQTVGEIPGNVVRGFGAGVASAGTGLLELDKRDTDATLQRIDLMDKIDRGEKVKPIKAEGLAAPADPQFEFAMKYMAAGEKGRGELRQKTLNEIAERDIEPSTEARIGQSAKKVGGEIFGTGQAMNKAVQAAVPLTPEEEQRPSVQFTRALTGLVGYVGAGAVGGLPGVIGFAGMEAMGQTYEEAKAKGASDEDAAAAGVLNGLVQGGLMTVPVGQALKVMDRLSNAAKGQFVKAVVESAKSGATLTAFTQIAQIADNAVAKSTYDPDRSLTQGLGEHLGPTFAAGAVLPVAGVAAARVANRFRAKPEDAARRVMDSGTVDEAIDTAKSVAEGTPVDVDAVAQRAQEYGGPPEQQQGKLLQLFGGLNRGTVEQTADGAFHFRAGEGETEATTPLKVWDEKAQRTEGAEPTIAPALAAAQRDHYGKLGIDIVYFENDAKIPFDGAMDPQNPNTIFLSSNPERNAAQVAAHEVTHVLESTTLPDGTNLGDVLHRQITEGLTNEGLRHAYETFGKTAPERAAFPAGPEGDSAHADAVVSHLVRELGADIGGEAPRFQTFVPKVVDAVQQRYGVDAAKDVLGKLIAGIREAMRTLRAFFSRPEELAEYGQPETASQHWVSNLDAIHQTLAKMYAERFGSQAEKETAALAAMRDRAQRERFIREGFAAFDETARRTAENRQEPARLTEPAQQLTDEPQRLTPDVQRPAVDAAMQRVSTLRRWLGELDQQRRDAAEASPQAALLRQTEAAILGKVKDVEDRLTGAGATRLERVRSQLDELLNPSSDNHDMAIIRQALRHEQERLADAAAARVPAERAKEPGFATPEEITPKATPADTSAGSMLARESAPPSAEVIPFNRPEAEPSFEPLAVAAESPKLSPRLRPRAWVEFGRNVERVLKGDWRKSEALLLGHTSEALKLAGLPDRWLVMPPDVASKAVGETTRRGAQQHSVDPEVLKRLPDMLDRPVAIFRSDTQPNAYAVIIDSRDANRKPVMVAIHAADGKVTVNRVLSLYGRERTEWFGEQIAKGNLLYLDTEKSRGLEDSIRLQLPERSNLGGTAAPGSERKIFTQADLGKPAFSPRLTGENPGRPYTAEQRQAFENVGRAVEPRTLGQHLEDFRRDLGKKILRETLDPFIGVKEIDPVGYQSLRLANSSAGAVEAFKTEGTLKFDGNAYAIADRNGGVEHLLVRPLKDEATDFIWWVAANRAERLKQEDRENLFSDADIAALKKLNRGDAGFDYELSNGKTTRSREAIYADSLRKLDGFNRNALELAVDAGLLKKGDVDALWRNPFYVPFYRQAEGDTQFVGPRPSSQFVKQNAFKALAGGTEKLNHDLWDNAFGNWQHMIDAAIRNKAAGQVLDTAASPALGAAEKLTAQQALHLSDKEMKRETVWVMEGGEKQYYRVTDPFLFKAVSALNMADNHSVLLDIGRAAKRLLQQGVTASPFFAVRNLIRDTEQTIAVSPLSANIFKNLATGFRENDLGGALENVARAAAGRELAQRETSPEAADALAGGGVMRLGTGTTAGIRDTKVSAMLDTPEAVQGFWNYVKTLGRAYRDVASQGEDVNRIALYHQLRAEGVPHDAATFAARDLMDFTLRGASPVVRAITDLVPFMNAWVQGLYKVGRAAADADRNVATAVGAKVLAGMGRRVAFMLGATTALTLALDAIYADDEDYKKRTEDDRNTYFWFKFGGAQVRIPMGFEIAAMSRIFANGTEAMFGLNEMTGARFMKNVWSILGNNMSLNPTPQAVAPVLDVLENTTRTGRAIETAGMERLEPQQRYTADSSLVSRGISTALNSALRAIPGVNVRGLSPVQLDYLANAYGGWSATTLLQGADAVMRSLSSEPVRPARDLVAMATGGMVSTETRGQSRYVDMLYTQGKEAEQAYATYRDMIQRGQAEEAQRFFKDNKDALQKHGLVSGLMRLEGDLNRQIRFITNNPDTKVTAEQKKIQIMQLQAMKSRAAEQVFGVRP